MFRLERAIDRAPKDANSWLSILVNFPWLRRAFAGVAVGVVLKGKVPLLSTDITIQYLNGRKQRSALSFRGLQGLFCREKKKQRGSKQLKGVRKGSDREGFRHPKEQKLPLKMKGSEVTRSQSLDLATPEGKHTYVS